AVDGRRGIEGQRLGPAAHGQRAGHGDTATSGPDSLRGEGDVRIVGAVEEVGRAQVRVAPGVLGDDGAATVSAPLTSPSGNTVPPPPTSRKTPFTRTRPPRLRLCRKPASR